MRSYEQGAVGKWLKMTGAPALQLCHLHFVDLTSFYAAFKLPLLPSLPMHLMWTRSVCHPLVRYWFLRWHDVGVAISAPEVEGSRVCCGKAFELCERTQVGADPLMRHPDIWRN